MAETNPPPVIIPKSFLKEAGYFKELHTFLFLLWKDVRAGGGGGSDTYSGLTDTIVTNPQFGDTTLWDGVSDWVNVPIVGRQETKTSDYTLQVSDIGKLLIFDSISPMILTIPDNLTSGGWPAIGSVQIFQRDVGSVTIAGGGSTILLYPDQPLLTGQNSTALAYLSGQPDEWILAWDLAASTTEDFFTVWTGGTFGTGMTLPTPYEVDSSDETSWRSAKTNPSFSRSSGRYAFEVSMTADRTTDPAPGDDVMAGFHQGGGNLSNNTYLGFDSTGWSVGTTGTTVNNNLFGSGSLFWDLASETAMMLVDIDAGTMSYRVNNVTEEIFTNLGVGVQTFAAIGALDNGIVANWGELPFINTLPSGYLPWNGAFS